MINKPLLDYHRPVEKSLIKALEYKHGTYCRSKNKKDDLLVIKENIHTVDGEIIPNLLLIKNYQRPFYVTKKFYRDHDDKKEWEDIKKLDCFYTPQINLSVSINRALERFNFQGNLRVLGRSPYLYGTDVSPLSLLSHQYKKEFPEVFSNNTVAVLDIETDVVKGTKAIISIALTYKERAFLTITKDFIGENPFFEEQLRKKIDELIGPIIKKRQCKVEILIADTPGQACYETLKRAHEWQPDFVTIWNMNYDLPYIKETLLKEGYDLDAVFSDQRVPPEYQFYKYVEGLSVKLKAGGVMDPIPVAERWHTAYCPARFYFIDSMCLYRRLRLAEQNEPSYSLDYQLNNHLGMRKLNIEGERDTHDTDWHVSMQKNRKPEYIVYNLFDCIGVELFDEKVKDLQKNISIQAGVSEYRSFKSQPKLLVDQLHFFCLEQGKVIGSVSDQMIDELDKYVTHGDGWVITLPAHLRTPSIINCVKELPNVHTEVSTHVSDLDIEGAYPTGQVVLNISKETTLRELFSIEGIPEEVKRANSINLTAGHVNAVEFCEAIFSLPSFDQMLDRFNSPTH